MPRDPAADRLIQALGLQPLPNEGGFYRQTWRSSTGSAIFFLLTRDDFSALHRLAQDEIWHFYAGDRVEHVQLDPREGVASIMRIGPDVLAGEHPQVTVPAGVWQGARLVPSARKTGSGSGAETLPAPGHGFALLGCTMSPPWDETGFTLGVRDDLVRMFPTQAEWIHALTR
jgi:hypothetical protein